MENTTQVVELTLTVEGEEIDCRDYSVNMDADSYEAQLRYYGMRSVQEADTNEQCYERGGAAESNLFTIYTYVS